MSPRFPMEETFFSIIVPTYNCAAKIEATILSVIDQREAPYELIVMDGLSQDDTLSIVRKYAEQSPDKIRWVSQKDAGVYDAMNKGIDLSRGKYLYFLGAGDQLRPGVLPQIAGAAPKQGPALLYGGTFWVDSQTEYKGLCSKEQLAVSSLCHQSIFYERSVFALVGRYELKYRTNADWALNIKCFGDSRIEKIFVDTIVADYEGGGMSATTFDPEFTRDRSRLAAQYLGVKTAGYRYFVTEQTLAIRTAKAPTPIARKFWLGQLWLLHNIVRPLFYGRLYRQARQAGKSG
ncbi:MAG TPA: glycosyltransferase family 2 protein [Capsulimonadaceae bacterium]|nr:glycosyltransferase family 2 protein [Capsulimonadaceae bacterium]